MKNQTRLKGAVAPVALSLALVAQPVFAQDESSNSSQTADSTSSDNNPIIVTGSRIARPELSSTSPVSVVSIEDIKDTGTTRIEDVLNQLPSVYASQASGVSNGSDGTASVDLRGLGSSRTLVLVDGRRLVPGDPSPTSGTEADINMIPASMLKRVEVLTGGASSVYGADAVAGVVNFIIDKDFEGFRVDGQYSFYQHSNGDNFITPLLDASGFDYPTGSVTDGGTFDTTLAFGTKFGDERGHIMAYFGYRKVKPVIQGNRDYSACVLQYSKSSGNPYCGGSATTPEGNVLVFDPNVTTGTSTFYTFTPNGGFENGLTLYNYAPLNYFQRNDSRYTAGVFADYEVNESIKPYMEFMFMDDSTTAQIAPSGDFANTQTINCDNALMSAAQKAVICAAPNLINGFLGTFPLAVSAAYNPNPGAPVIDFPDGQGGTYNMAFFQPLRRNVEGGPRQGQYEHTTYRAVLGVKGDLGDAWNYDAYYQYGRNNYSQVYVNELSIARLKNALDVVTDNRPGSSTFGDPVCRSVITGSDPNCVPYDLFAGKGGASQAAVNYLSASGFQRGHTQEQVINASLTGDLGNYGVKFPWASDGIKVNFGTEWRKEQLDLKVDQEFETGDLTGQGGPTLPINGSFKVLEFFGETQIPVVQDGFVQDFSLSAGYRYSHYSTSAGATYNTNTFKLGAELAPVSDIRFRAMFNRAVRAPNIQELFAAINVNLDGSEDPCAGITVTATDYGCIAQGLAVGQGTPANPASQYNGKLGGNPNLKPEKADTWTFGVVLQPSFVPRLAVTVDYFNIKLTDAIRSFGADAILSDCVAKATATFTPSSCDLVHRDAAGSIWLTPGGYVTDLPANVGSVQTAGIEVNGSYRYPLNFGALNLSFQGTYLDKYKVDNGLTEPYDCAGYYGGTCSAGGTTDSGAPLPRWRHKARLSLQTNSNIGVSLQWRYVGPVTAEVFSPSSTLAGSLSYYGKGLHIGAQSYFDLMASYTFMEDYKLRIGVNNIFDKQPPYVPSGTLCPTGPCNGNTYPGTWDALGRYIFAGVTLDF